MNSRWKPSVFITLAFGVVLPIMCLVFDPIVFRSLRIVVVRDLPLGAPLLGAFKVAGYAATALGVLSLGVWLTAKRPPEFLCGLLAGGATFALGLGVILLPFTVIFLTEGIGVLGLVPFGTAWVYAWQARAASAGRTVGRWAIAGFLAACAGPLGVQLGADAVVRTAIERVAAAGRLTPLTRAAFVIDGDAVVWGYVRETDPDRRRRLADAYAQATGDDIDARCPVLCDTSS